MKLGYSYMNRLDDVRPDALAAALEERGFDSLWIGEHPHVPTSRRTPYPAGGAEATWYIRQMDPFVSLTMAACASRRLLLATGVALPLEHDVFDLAKTVATLDQLSGGRFLFGVGAGWNVEELENHRPGLPWGQRYRALAECIAALKILWCDDEAEFHGTWFDFDPVWSYPKPARAPHPPVYCGMAGKLGSAHAVVWADGWMPMDIGLGDVARKVGKFRQIAADAGRGDMPITILTYGDPTAQTLHQYQELGIERAVIGAARTGWDDRRTTMPFLDRYAELIPDLAPGDHEPGSVIPSHRGA